jgi:hypothetical protein
MPVWITLCDPLPSVALEYCHQLLLPFFKEQAAVKVAPILVVVSHNRRNRRSNECCAGGFEEISPVVCVYLIHNTWFHNVSFTVLNGY